MKTQQQRAAEVILALLAAVPPALASEPAQGIVVPQGQALLSSVHATGHQLYECKLGANGPQWAFKAPEATLKGTDGQRAGTHYAGPTWQATDGSTVVGQVVTAVPSAGTIPHLLLQRKDGTGPGQFDKVAYVVRRDTVGGLPPAEACDAASVSRIAKSPYEATYDFYGAATR